MVWERGVVGRDFPDRGSSIALLVIKVGGGVVATLIIVVVVVLEEGSVLVEVRNRLMSV